MRITNKKMTCYMAFRDMQIMLLLFVLTMLVYGVMAFITGDFTGTQFEIFLIVYFLGVGSSIYSFRKYDLYGSFWFCRKEMYITQVWINMLRALFIAVVHTVIHVVFAEEYLEMAAEDMGVADITTLHSLPVWQQFIISFLLFYALYLVLVIDSTTILGIWSMDNKSRQMQARSEAFKNLKFHKLIAVIVYLMKFAAAIGGIVLILFRDDKFITADIKEGWIWIGSLVAVNALLLVIMRVRYQPKYI